MEQKMQQSKGKQRILYLDILRIISTFAVMILHLSATGHKTAPEGSGAWVICWGFDYLSRFAVPVFVMISGALFLNPHKNVTLTTLLKRNIPRLLLIFQVWSAGYALLQSARECTLFSTAYFLSVIRKTITGHYHMWYLYMIVGLYLAVPFLRPIAADRTLLRQFLLLCFALNSLPQLLYSIPVVGEVVREVMNKADIGFFAGYAGYFCLGYYLHSTQISQSRVKTLGFLTAVLMPAVAVLGVKAGWTALLLQERMPHIALYSSAVFLMLKEHAQRLERCEPRKKWIDKAAACSLGMYLVHPVVNFILKRCGLHALTFFPILCVPLCGIVVWMISFCLILMIKKCPVLNQTV